MGTSVRYGAIALLGLRWLSEKEQRAILKGKSAGDLLRRLVADVHPRDNLGDLALLTWAAGELGLTEAANLVDVLRQREATTCACYTVEAAWVLSALVAARDLADVRVDAASAASRLLQAFAPAAGVFPHWTPVQDGPWYHTSSLE